MTRITKNRAVAQTQESAHEAKIIQMPTNEQPAKVKTEKLLDGLWQFAHATLWFGEKFNKAEITHFKKLKTNFKNSFKGFLKKSNTSLNKIAISNNEKYLVSGGDEGILKIWDPLHLTLIKSLCFHKSIITCIDIDIKSQFILSGSCDRIISLWNLNSLKLQKCFAGHLGWIHSVKFVISSKIFASGSFDKTIRLWSTLNSNLIWKLDLEDHIIDILKCRYSNKNLVCCTFTKIYKLNLKHKKIISNISRKSMPICGIIIQKKIKVGYEDGTIETLEYSNLRSLDNRKIHLSAISSIEFIESKSILVTASHDKFIKFWDISNMKLINILNSHESSVKCVIFKLNRLYSCGEDAKIYYYNSSISLPQNESKSKIYFAKSFALSIELKLLTFGAKSLKLYCLKSEIETGSVAVTGLISRLSFVKSIIVCGNNIGQVLLIDSDSLNIKNKFNLAYTEIFYCLLSEDFKLLT